MAMYVKFSFTRQPSPVRPVALTSVYALDADPTYDVRKSGWPGDSIVALRTLGGAGRVKIEGFDEVDATPGTLLFFRHRDVRRYYCADESWRFWWFDFFLDSAEGIPMNRVTEVSPACREEEDAANALRWLQSDDPSHNALASSCFALILHQWLLHLRDEGANPHRDAVRKAIAYMRDNLTQAPSVKDAARNAGFCDRRFRQIFQQVTGQPPKKYLHTLRIGIAEELLKNSPLSMLEIADRLGYSSQFHFTADFRAATGLPPSHFRRSAGQAAQTR